MRARLPAHEALRSGTAADHERLDGLFARFDLAYREGYGRFLLAHAAALLPIEAALDAAGMADLLPDWPERKRGALILADLAALGREMPSTLALPAFKLPAAAWGAAYVIEGSRLGGALLARSVARELPTRYLEAPQPAGAWRKFLEMLDAALVSGDECRDATKSAREVFVLFEEAGRRYRD